MKKNILRKVILCAVMLAWMPAILHANEQVYTVGVVPQFEAKRTHEIWRPILDKIEDETGLKLTLIGAPTIPVFEKEFAEGAFDFVYMNPYHILMANESQGYLPLVRDVGRKLNGVLVVRKGSYASPEQLDGKVIAFPAPNALGASLVMRADLENLFNIKFQPQYVKTHSSVYLNVALGRAEAGGGVQKTLSQQPRHVRDALEVIYETRKVAPHPFSVHPRVSDDVSHRVQAALLNISRTDSGRELLKEVPIREIGVASLEDYFPIREMGLERLYVNE